MRSRVNRGQTVDDIMHRAPGVVRVFLDNGMLCVGCPIARFHTLADACEAHGLDIRKLTLQLEAASSARGVRLAFGKKL